MTTYPVLDSQLGVILACSASPDTTAWNLPSVIVFDKTISAEKLVCAVNDICNNRVELHVQFVRTKEGTVMQYADTTMTIPVRHTKMKDRDVQEYLERGFVRPFQLFGHSPLCRFEIVETEKRTLLLSDLHHSIADGFTIAGRLIGSDLPAAYEGKQLLPPLLTVFDWARRQQEEMGTPAYHQAKAFFHELFADAEVTRLAIGSAHEEGKEIMETISVKMNVIDEWCAQRRVSAYHFLMSAFCLTLSKLSHQRKLVFCILNHGRYDKKLNEAYGMFVNTLPFVAEIDPQMTIGMLVAQVKTRLMDIYRHRKYPFTHFCSHTGLVPKITFGFQSSGILEQTVIEGRRFKGMQLRRPHSRSDLSVMVYSSGDNYEIRVEASDALYDRADLRRFANAMYHCIFHLMQNDGRPIGEIELMGDSQKKEILKLSAGEKHTPPPVRGDRENSETAPPHTEGECATVVELFLRQAAATPDAIAVDDDTEKLTYRQLELQTRSLALTLMDEGVRKGSFVGIDTTPCAAFLIAALAVMRAGGAYVPIAAELPPKRRQQIVDDAGIRLVLDADYVNKHALSDGLLLPCDLSSSDQPAYMIYTSGTSGVPKGVVVGHAALSNLIHFCVRRWPLDSDSRIACQSTFAFDASVEDLFPVLTVGGCVVIVPAEIRVDIDELAFFMRRKKVTGGCLTTGLGVAMAERHSLEVDYLCLGGERLMTNPAVKGRVYNTYGPTEFTVDATYFELERGKHYEHIPIGRPLDNCHAFVVDPYGCLLPQGAVGELWLAGPQVAVGYWNAPELTSEKFTTCSFYDGTVYHTGDLVRWNDDGQLEFVARMDNQVKIDGVRIALEEIERSLLGIQGVEEAAVVTRDMNGKPQIQAFFTSKEPLSIDEIKTRLKESLPAQMVPRQLVRLEKMPTTTSGKIDRLALHVEKTSNVETAPVGTTEWVICQLMAQVIGMERVGRDDDFFDLGGTSLSAMQMVADARKMGLFLSYADIFSHSTPRLLCSCVGNGDSDARHDIDHYDYSGINRLLASDTVCCGRSFPDGGTLLLTGVTGFLGAHVLARFLESPKWKVVGLVRGHDQQEAWHRMRERWSYYFGQQPLDTERFDVVLGDLTQPSDLKMLEEVHFDVVVNCAADVRYFAKDDNIMQVNAHGVEYLAQLCLKKNARLVQVSTLSVAGLDPSGDALAKMNSSLYMHQRLMDEYSLSKFLAERTILERMVQDGLMANIIRVGYLAPREGDGKFSINAETNMLHSLLKTMADLGGCPKSIAQKEVTWAPVEDVADGIFCQSVVCPSHPVMLVEGMKRSSIKELADIHAGRVLPLWSDDDFRKKAFEQQKTGWWMPLLGGV